MGWQGIRCARWGGERKRAWVEEKKKQGNKCMKKSARQHVVKDNTRNGTTATHLTVLSERDALVVGVSFTRVCASRLALSLTGRVVLQSEEEKSGMDGWMCQWEAEKVREGENEGIKRCTPSTASRAAL